MGTYWEEYKKLEDNIYSRKKIDRLLKQHGKATRAIPIHGRYDYEKGICENTRSPEKMSPHASLLLFCNYKKGRTWRISSAAKSLLKKYQKKKMRQWLKKEIQDF